MDSSVRARMVRFLRYGSPALFTISNRLPQALKDALASCSIPMPSAHRSNSPSIVTSQDILDDHGFKIGVLHFQLPSSQLRK